MMVVETLGLHNLIAMTIIAQKLFSNLGKKIVGDTPHQAISAIGNNTIVQDTYN